MANKLLSYGSHDGAELFNTDRDYTDGSPRAAARSDYFIDFTGYLLRPIDPSTELPTPPTGTAIIFRDEADDVIKVKTDSGVSSLISPGDISFSSVDAKTTLVAADTLLLLDSADSDETKKITLTNLRKVLSDSVATITNTDSPYSAVYNRTILVNPNGDDVDIELPDPTVLPGGIITVKRITAGDTVTILPNGTEDIEDAASYVVAAQYDSVRLVSDGTNWWVI